MKYSNLFFSPTAFCLVGFCIFELGSHASQAGMLGLQACTTTPRFRWCLASCMLSKHSTNQATSQFCSYF